MAEKLAIKLDGLVDDNRNAGCAECGKSPVVATRRAGAARGYDAEMVRSVRSQPADIRIHVQIRAPCLGLGGGHGPVAGRCSVFKMYGRAQSCTD